MILHGEIDLQVSNFEFRNSKLDFAVEERLFDLADRFRNIDAARASLHTIEDGAAAPDPVHGVEYFEPFLAAFVAAVEDEARRIHNRRRTEVGRIRPERRAGGGAG